MSKKSHSGIGLTCVVCGKLFYAFRKDALSCSMACRALKHKGQVGMVGMPKRRPRQAIFAPFTFCG